MTVPGVGNEPFRDSLQGHHQLDCLFRSFHFSFPASLAPARALRHKTRVWSCTQRTKQKSGLSGFQRPGNGHTREKGYQSKSKVNCVATKCHQFGKLSSFFGMTSQVGISVCVAKGYVRQQVSPRSACGGRNEPKVARNRDPKPMAASGAGFNDSARTETWTAKSLNPKDKALETLTREGRKTMSHISCQIKRSWTFRLWLSLGLSVSGFPSLHRVKRLICSGRGINYLNDKQTQTNERTNERTNGCTNEQTNTFRRGRSWSKRLLLPTK